MAGFSRRPKCAQTHQCIRSAAARRGASLHHFETLEGRELFAGDAAAMFTAPVALHNTTDAEDVNADGQCTPVDALVVLNQLDATNSFANPASTATVFSDVNQDGKVAPLDALLVVNRLNSQGSTPSADMRRPPGPSPTPTPTPTTDVRSIDGSNNNLSHRDWGSTDEDLLRGAASQYGDGISSPAGASRPSARAISNALAAHSDEATPNDHNVTAYIYVWGQFLDHDLDLTTSATPREAFNVTVPTGDAYFDPNGTGTQIIPLSRSVYDAATGASTSNPRQQINQITAWIDGSMVYGSDATRAAALRTYSGGQLKSQDTALGEMLPLNTAGLANANDAHRAPDNQLFLAGDVRANENVELTSLHTIFLREHNRLAAQIAAANPQLGDEAIYQRARALVIAEIQSITYNQWLPAMLGSGALQPYRGYKSSVNPDISNEFSTAAFRLHTSINDDVEFFDNQGRPIQFSYTDDYGGTTDVDGEVSLFDAFFNPTMLKQTGVDGILKYAASTLAERFDNQLVDSLRNFLFGLPGQGGLDLASLNIQRGRDHGLADYNTERAAYGLPKVTSFSQITSNREVAQKLAQLYGNVNNIDLWVGALAEDHVAGSSVGPLAQRILIDQFRRLRDGDRFWFENAFTGRQLDQLEHTTLADVIERNSDVTSLQDNVFIFRAEASGQVFIDVNGNGQLGRGEVGMAHVTLELLNDEGEVVATTKTDRDGRYHFNQFGETGDYQVRVTLPAGFSLPLVTRDLLISTGDQSVRNLNFGLRPVARITTSTGEVAEITRITTSDLFVSAQPTTTGSTPLVLRTSESTPPRPAGSIAPTEVPAPVVRPAPTLADASLPVRRARLAAVDQLFGDPHGVL